MHRLVRRQLNRLNYEADEISELIEAYRSSSRERTTLVRVSRHLKLHQISAANLLVWLDHVGADMVAPKEVLSLQERLERASEDLEELVQSDS